MVSWQKPNPKEQTSEGVVCELTSTSFFMVILAESTFMSSWLKLVFVSITAIMIFSLGGCKLKKTATSLPKLVGQHTFSIPLHKAPAGTVIFVDQGTQKPEPFCGGTYIKPGVVITTAHCLGLGALSLPTPSPTGATSLIFANSESLTLSSQNNTVITHVESELALIFFDPKLLSSSPATAELALPLEGEGEDLMLGARFYGAGRLHLHPDYPSTAGDEILLRGSKDLMVLTTNQENGFEKLSAYLEENSIEGAEFLIFVRHIARNCSTKPGGWGCHQASMIHMLVSTNLKQNNKIPGGAKEVLICPGDSGGGLRNSEGKLIGVALGGLPLRAIADSKEPGSYEYDQKALDLGCSYMGFFTNLHTYYDWIHQNLKEHSLVPQEK